MRRCCGGGARALAIFTSGSTIGRSIALLVTGATLSLLAVAVQGGYRNSTALTA